MAVELHSGQLTFRPVGGPAIMTPMRTRDKNVSNIEAPLQISILYICKLKSPIYLLRISSLKHSIRRLYLSSDPVSCHENHLPSGSVSIGNSSIGPCQRRRNPDYSGQRTTLITWNQIATSTASSRTSPAKTDRCRQRSSHRPRSWPLTRCCGFADAVWTTRPRYPGRAASTAGRRAGSRRPERRAPKGEDSGGCCVSHRGRLRTRRSSGAGTTARIARQPYTPHRKG